MSTASEKLFLGRHPILNRHRELIGYEILFRPAASSLQSGACPAAATADVVCNTFAELGLAQALGNQRAFIAIGREFLANDLILLLPVHTVVLTITPPMLDEVDIQRCQELRTAGYEFALSGLDRLDAHNRNYLTLASYVCLNIEEDQEVGLLPQLQSQREASHHPALTFIATGVNTPKLQARADLLGFDCFQGYAFARPELITGRKLGAATHALMSLLNLINNDADAHEIEAVMKGEPGLVANLLRLVNSAAIGLATRVTSIRQAINVLGRVQLQRWLQLLLFAHPHQDGIRSNPLMQMAALRGYFLELLVQRCYPARREMHDPAFIVGLMSVMPAALEMPMEEILAQIVVADEVREALATHGGPLGQLLELAECYDNNDIPSASTKLAQMGGRLGEATLNLCLTEAIAWMLSLDVENQ